MTFTWTHMTIIVAAYHVELAREIGGALDPAGARMYETGLSENGRNPATHYISSGLVNSNFASILDDPIAIYEAAKQGAYNQGIELSATQEDVNALVKNSYVSLGDPFSVMAERGLVLVQPDIQVGK